MSNRFSKPTVLTLAQRAGYLCSNPECRALTVGPNSEGHKSTIIGEAAHIFGANKGAARYDPNMASYARGDITNGIWLCANCHKVIDKDENNYPSTLLFRWKDLHDSFVAAELGSINDELRQLDKISLIDKYLDYPAIVRRMITDRPSGWEYAITAEFLRFLCEPEIRKINDLMSGMYVRPLKKVELYDFFSWQTTAVAQMVNLVQPTEKLIVRLNESWGAPGEPGNLEEIHHTCNLIKDLMQQVILFEEEIAFLNVDEECEKLVKLMQDVVASQFEKLMDIPNKLDSVVDLIRSRERLENTEPLVIEEVVQFDLPDEWAENMQEEGEKLLLIIQQRQIEDAENYHY